jgi:hypothetical protein
MPGGRSAAIRVLDSGAAGVAPGSDCGAEGRIAAANLKSPDPTRHRRPEMLACKPGGLLGGKLAAGPVERYSAKKEVGSVPIRGLSV